MLFPSIDVISIYPLIVITTVNNIYIVVFGRDSAFARTSCKSYLILQMLKAVVAILPLLVALSVSNLVTVLKYAGLLSFFIAFMIPTVLQIRSQWVCRREFSKVDINQQELHDSDCETSQLLSGRKTAPSSALYTTPYSTVFSHWIFAAILGVVEILLTVLAFAGTIMSSN